VRNNAIAVPQVAVQDGAQGKFVYVTGKDKDGKDIASCAPSRWETGSKPTASNLWIVESGSNRRHRDRRRYREAATGGAIALGGGGGHRAPGCAPRGQGSARTRTREKAPRVEEDGADGAQIGAAAPSPDRELPHVLMIHHRPPVLSRR
jgi:hypothetical protein